MNHIDPSILTPDQEQAFLDCYRFIRQRAAWLRAQKTAANESSRTIETVSAEELTRQPQPKGGAL